MALELGKIFETTPVKTSLTAYLLVIIGQYFFYEQMPIFKNLLIGVITITLVAFFVWKKQREENFTNYFVMGVVAYLAYALALTFFKISESFVFVEETKIALVFGGLCAIAYSKFQR